jgi:integrase
MISYTDKQLTELKQADCAKTRLADETGLYLKLRFDHDAGHQWRFDYQRPIIKKPNTMVLGLQKYMTKKEARAAADKLRAMLAKGIDPVATKQVAEEAKQQALVALTVAQKREAEGLAPAGSLLGVCQDYKAGKLGSGDWKAKGATEWINIIKRSLPLEIAHMPIEEVKPMHILQQVIRPLEAAGLVPTSQVVRKNLAQVFDYAEVMELRQGNPARVLRGQVKQNHVAGHNPAVTTPTELKTVLEKIMGWGNPITRTALQVQVAIWQRPGETCSMRWPDVDLEAGLWNAPIVAGTKLAKSLKHVKGGVHVVPLPKQVVAMLRALKSFTGHTEWVFLSPMNTGKPITNDTLTNALRSMGLGEIQNAHGFRATGRTMVVEQLGLSAQVAECQLAHSAGIQKADGTLVKDGLRGAYDRATFLPERIEMIQAWADYLDQLMAQPATELIEAEPLKLAA